MYMYVIVFLFSQNHDPHLVEFHFACFSRMEADLLVVQVPPMLKI